MKMRCAKGSEEVGRGQASPHCSILLKLQVLQRQKDIVREHCDLEMGSVPLIKRRVACWGRGRTFQMVGSAW